MGALRVRPHAYGRSTMQARTGCAIGQWACCRSVSMSTVAGRSIRKPRRMQSRFSGRAEQDDLAGAGGHAAVGIDGAGRHHADHRRHHDDRQQSAHLALAVIERGVSFSSPAGARCHDSLTATPVELWGKRLCGHLNGRRRSRSRPSANPPDCRRSGHRQSPSTWVLRGSR